VVTGLESGPIGPASRAPSDPAAGGSRRGDPVAVSAIRIVLADDHELVRRSARALLDGEDGIEVVAEASDIESTIRLLREERPCALVLDLWMSGSPGVGVIESLRGRAPEIQIVVMTMQDDPAFAEHVLAAGAVGFVVKEHAADELACAVRAAAHGERYVSPRVARRRRSPAHMDTSTSQPAG
jgi:DNA-binding NarL/FixJ family response regulator